MTLARVVDAVQTRFLLVLMLGLLGVVTGAGVAMATPSSYVSTATVLLRWVGPNADQAITVNIRYVGARASTYSFLVERTSVLNEAVKQSGVEVTATDLAKRTESFVPLNSQTIQIRSRSDNPENAMRLVNATADALVREVALEEQGTTTGKANVDSVVAVRGGTPSSADSPRIAIYVSVGALFGASLGLLLAIVLDHLNGRRYPRRSCKPSPAHSPARHFGLRHLAWAAMIAATIPWRSNAFYESGADPVVIAKAAISILALAISIWAYRHAAEHSPLPATPIMLLLAYLAVTVIGGLASFHVAAALVITIRVLILMTTIVLLVTAYGPNLATRSFIQMLAVLISISAVVGVRTFDGRLGGLMHPNALAFATAVVGVWLLSRVLAGEDHGWELFAFAFCVVIVFLTGSRSSLAAFGVAALAIIFRITTLRKRTLLILAVSLPVVTYIATATDLITSVFSRGGSEQVATLSNRTIAWESAVSLQRDFWQTWFGQGLQQKKIPVPGQWWDTQLLDSSWISALVQGGNLGAALAILLGLATLLYAASAPRPQGAVWLGLTLLTTLTGVLESGLLDGSLLFMVFWVASLGAFSGHLDKITTLDPARQPLLTPREKSNYR